MQASERLLGYLVVAVLVAGMVVLRLRRLSRAQPLRLERLWIVPALLIAGLAVVLAQTPPQGRDWLWLGLALAIGGALGWVRGRTMAIAVDPQSHALNVRASPAAIVFLVVLLAARFGLRSLVTGHEVAWRLSAAFVADMFLIFAVGLLGVQRLEMAIRARRLLAAHRGAAEDDRKD